jgi:alkanesulfonate monooxygenase SsuD/methylene tetrahydromethanopterin reductase-like flavin-dependent oxidoreductase (luciferase family)
VPVRFGATICQIVPFPLLRDDFVFAESIGLDNAGVIDQFGIDGAPEVPLLEAWTTLAGLARETERIGSVRWSRTSLSATRGCWRSRS